MCVCVCVHQADIWSLGMVVLECAIGLNVTPQEAVMMEKASAEEAVALGEHRASGTQPLRLLSKPT